MMSTPNLAVNRLHKDFAFIVLTVADMKEIDEEFGGVDNAEFYDQLIVLAKATREALNYYNDAISRGIIGPDAE